jgi:hypothetical protein
MNGPHLCRDVRDLDILIRELTDTKRPVTYRLSEILVVPRTGALGWHVWWQKDGRK